MLAGIEGHLLSGHVLEERLNANVSSTPVPARDALVTWRTSQRLLGPATSIRTMFEAGAAPLAQLLGFRTDAIAIESDLCAATLRSAGASVALLVSRWGERLNPL